MRCLTAIVLLSVAACDRSLADARPQGAPLLKPSAAPPPTHVASADPEPTPASTADDPADALRREDWQAAADMLDALGPDLQAKPELRYARARAAVELEQHERALELLSGLESLLPALGDRVRRLRAEAQLEAGPYEEAAAYFSQQRDMLSLLRAGTALRRAGKLVQARAALDRALTTKEGKSKKLVPRIHAERAALFEQQGEKQRAVTELRWLALEAPLSELARDADERLAALVPQRALTKDERAARLMTFAEAGKVEAVEREIEKLGATKGPALGRGKVAYARGYALYASRSDYAKASELLSLAARSGAPDPTKASFYAARALARAHQDDRAIAAYRELARRYPKTMWAEYGTYLVAKTYYSGGRFNEALSGYDAYLSRYGKKGRYLGSVASERAVALLAAGRHAEAARALEQLRRGTRDARERARLFELEGAARAGAGENAASAELFRKAVSEQPLSFAALAASARLERLGEPVPAPLAAPEQPASSPPPLQIKLPEPVSLLTELGLHREAELELLPRERVLESQYPARGREALCRAYGRLDVAGRRYQIAQSSVDGSVLRSAPSPATLWQWECIYPRPHELLVREASKNLGISEMLLWSIMRQESGFRPDVVSPANAVGLMQLIPPTAERVAKELSLPYDQEALRSPAYNVKLGSYYLKKLLDFFGGHVALAAAAYNAGPQAVFRWLDRCSDLPLDVFVARIPYEETQGYVERVLGNYARYRYVEAGEAGLPKLALELPKGLEAPSDLY